MEAKIEVSKRIIFLILVSLLAQGVTARHADGLENRFVNSLGMEFVLIPAGTFTMGSPPDEPYRHESEIEHEVTISEPFYMQSTEVTLKQWWALMRKKFFGRRKGKENSPVVKVSWFDCIDFIDKLNKLDEGTYRLPTEAEWEYACRAGSATAYSWGNDIDCTKAMYHNSSSRSGKCLDYVKSRGLANDRPAPVKSYGPNAWRLYDMHGNVWEWCQDWFSEEYPKGAVVDPRGPDWDSEKKGKVRRGGSWYRYGASCRSANRAHANPASKFRTTGFRIVREAQ